MKYLNIKFAAITMLIALSLGTASAKQVVVPKMYMFGFAASFNDTIIHFTNVMEVDSAWIESKNKFLLGRALYSRQLKNYLTKEKAMPQRTCVVLYAPTRQKAEKQLVKMRKLYTESKDKKKHFDIRFIDENEFRFKSINMEELMGEEEEAQTPPTKKDKKGKKPKKK